MLAYHFEGVPRNPLTVAIKNVLTLGIHTKLWLYRVNREMDGHEGFHIHLPALGALVTLPIVTPAVVKFQTAARLNSMVSHQVTQPVIRSRGLGWISLVPVLGSGFYAYWVQSTLNRHWFWHRREERMRLIRDRIAELAQQPETEENLALRFELEEEHRRLEREIEEEIEAARVRWGEARFNERKERAELHAQRGRLTRKELAALRAQNAERRKTERTARRRARNPFAGLKPRKADPEDDDAWRPETPLPARLPDEIRQAAAREEREPTKSEAKEIKTAERLIAKRAKEEARLGKRREKLQGAAAKEREREEKKRLKAAAGSEKQRAKEEEKEAKRREKEEARAGKKKKKSKVDELEFELGSEDAAEPAAKEPTARERKQAVRAERRAAREEEKQAKAARKAAAKAQPDEPEKPQEEKTRRAFRLHRRAAAAPEAASADAGADAETPASGGASTLRVIKVRCPRCRTAIEVQKQGDVPARLSCTSCGLVGKV